MLLAIAVTCFVCSCDDDGMLLWSDEVPTTNLPRVSLTTAGQADITRKMLDAEIVVENVSGGTDYSGSVMVKGRGNVSWWAYPKKSYTFFLKENVGLLSMEKGNTFALIANYYDATMIRNDVAMYMGREMSRLEYTPDCRYADLVLNGRYMGVYQVFETIDVAAHRVNVGDDGFILEIDGKARYDDILFYTTRIGTPFNIKYPETTENSADYIFIRDFVQQAEDALYSSDFLDVERGYRQYFDMESLVEWYLVCEITKNADAAFHTSCYLSLARGGKLRMGPLWDFDLAFGNYDAGGNVNDPLHCYFKDKGWFVRLFEDPAFVSMVKSRFNDYYVGRQKIYDRIDEDSKLLASRMVWNNKVWGTLCKSSSSEERVLSAYSEQIERLKGWIETRMNSLKEEIDRL